MNRTTLIALAALGVVLFLYYRSRQQSAALAATPMNSLAHATTYVSNTSGYYLNKAGVVGRVGDAIINDPLTNVTGGNASDIAWSAATGGLSDVWKAL
jgi:hypothetical protein